MENERLQKKQQLEDRTKRFAIAVFKMLKDIPYDVSTKVIGYQIGKSASSIGANYREANRCESKEDFIHKISIVLKEASETLYWLEILQELYPTNDKLTGLRKESNELVCIFQAVRKSLITKSQNKQTQQSVNRSIG